MPGRLLFLTLFLSGPLAGAKPPPLTTLAEVRAVPHEQASKHLPVEVEGTVVYFDRGDGNAGQGEGLILHDGTAGCYATFTRAIAGRERIKPGTRVRIKGFTNPNSYFTNIGGLELEVLGQGGLPEPRHITGRDLFTRWVDAEWVEIGAVVVGVEPGGKAFTLVVEIDGRTFKAEVSNAGDAKQRAAALMQRRVRLRGVVGTIANDEWQMTGRHFFVPSFDQIIPVDGDAGDEAAPLRTIGTLLKSDQDPEAKVRVRGVVTQLGVGGFYFSDGTGSTFVHAADGIRYPPGSEVEVQGFAAVAPFRPILRAAQVELLGETPLAPPVRFEPGKGLDVSLHDSRVTVDCVFLAFREGLNETVLQCRDKDSYFEAWLPVANRHEHDLQPGDELRLTGICEVTTTRPMPRLEWADGFRLHLAGPAGVVVLHSAPWWTLERMFLAFGIVIAVLFGAFIWAGHLRRRVAVQSAIITRQIQQGVIKDERDRIARELHDTLEQDLTGLSILLGNLSSSLGDDKSPGHERLSLARRMLQHCRVEARASVGDLRNPHLLNRSLAEAMRESLPEAAGGAKDGFSFELDGTPRPIRATTQNHLLRIAREAVTNATRHAAPESIKVRLLYDPEGVTLEIDDDGTGFDTGQKPPAGHFGLIGMRERANKIHADFSLTSSPEAGTGIRVFLPWSSPVAHPRKRS